ncbi:MAG: cytochrome d ubiquinol oxidase subunit II [Gammaproteobacteria bacterium]
MPIDYTTLRLIWWLLLGILLIGFAVTDGFDFGVGMLLPFLTRNDNERRILINTIAPTWEGNQVWLILGGGAIFAAFPLLYAVAFSGFYLAMMLVLIGLILRPVGFKYRSKLTSSRWRSTWDILICLGSFIPSLVFGVAIGNVLQGVPFQFDDSLRIMYTGSFWQLLNPFAVLCGILTVLMFLLHGSLFITTKTENNLQARARFQARIYGLLLIATFIGAGIWLKLTIPGYSIVSAIDTAGPANPLNKQIAVQLGAWLTNYNLHPWMMIAPIMGIAGAGIAALLTNQGQGKLAFVSSALSIAGIILTFGFSIFPFLLPSSTTPNASLLIWDASSSQLTLFIMLIVTIIFMPIILLYTRWVYKVVGGKITLDTIMKHKGSYY